MDPPTRESVIAVVRKTSNGTRKRETPPLRFLVRLADSPPFSSSSLPLLTRFVRINPFHIPGHPSRPRFLSPASSPPPSPSHATSWSLENLVYLSVIANVSVPRPLKFCLFRVASKIVGGGGIKVVVHNAIEETHTGPMSTLPLPPPA